MNKKLKAGLVIALATQIGTDKKKAIHVLKSELKAFGYDPKVIKPTSIIEEMIDPQYDGDRFLKEQPVGTSQFELRYHRLIDTCNFMCAQSSPDYVARVAVEEVKRIRNKWESEERSTSQQKHKPLAFIIDQVKRPKEVDLLRSVYGERFLLFSLYSPREARERNLAVQIAKSLSSTVNDYHRASALSLVARDRQEFQDQFGQRAELVFSLGDVVIDVTDVGHMKTTMELFFRSFFGDNVSPTTDEYGMYLAWSASYRSSDLSRQVGAAVFTPEMEILALGCNEVPKAGGGTYFRKPKQGSAAIRDYDLGLDMNASIKSTIGKNAIDEILGVVSGKDSQISEELVEQVLGSDSLLINDITEFGRAVHAEMNAITDAARKGRSLKGATLYCTTFPCHNCAKHIVASGIQRVVYIQPYPKSRAAELYSDSIAIDPVSTPDGMVVFEPHIGVTPSIYLRTYQRGRSKDSQGFALDFDKEVAEPPIPSDDFGYFSSEEANLGVLIEMMGDLDSSEDDLDNRAGDIIFHTIQEIWNRHPVADDAS